MDAGLIASLRKHIANYYDFMVNQIDIYTEEQLETYAATDLMPHFVPNAHIKSNKTQSPNFPQIYKLKTPSFSEMFDLITDPYSDEYSYNQIASISTPLRFSGNQKIHDYLNEVRDKLIDELRRVENETQAYLETIKNSMRVDLHKSVSDQVEQVRRAVFARKFCFILKIDTITLDTYQELVNSSPFKMYLFVIDFYMDRSEQKIFR